MSISPLRGIPVDGLVDERAPEAAESVRGARQVFEGRAPSRDFEEESVVGVSGVWRIGVSARRIGGRSKDEIKSIARRIGREKSGGGEAARAGRRDFFFSASTRERVEKRGRRDEGKEMLFNARDFPDLATSPLEDFLRYGFNRYARK